MKYLLVLSFFLLSFAAYAKGTETLAIAIASLSDGVAKTYSNLEPIPEDIEIAGAELAITDNNSTGRFLKQKFVLHSLVSPEREAIQSSIENWVEQGIVFIVLSVPKDFMLQLSQKYQDKGVVFFNVRNRDNELRTKTCPANIWHIIPSHAIYADALAQFLVTKRWTNWLLLKGNSEQDALFIEALRLAAKKFGAKIEKQLDWTYGPDSRRTAQKQVPVLTQGIDYDILLVADSLGEFGEYLLYQTRKPLLVAGSQGLHPTTWHWTHEQWGAAQLQSRFLKQFKRKMLERDYLAWLAVRVVGEAATRDSLNRACKNSHIFAE